MSSKKVKEIYWMHLRPKTMSCDDDLWSLTLRIHFKYLGDRKIEIDWIGRHLYIPCPKRNRISDCHRPKCPLNYKQSLLHDQNDNELTNYLKQWPELEQEPENDLSKAEDPEKSLTISPENH